MFLGLCLLPLTHLETEMWKYSSLHGQYTSSLLKPGHLADDTSCISWRELAGLLQQHLTLLSWHITLSAKRLVVSWRCHHLACSHDDEANAEANAGYADKEEEEVWKSTCICNIKTFCLKWASHMSALPWRLDSSPATTLSFMHRRTLNPNLQGKRRWNSPLHHRSKVRMENTIHTPTEKQLS